MMRVALDATPLLGSTTGVATFTGGLLRALADRDDVELEVFAMSLRGRARLRTIAPPRALVARRPMPAGVLTRIWRRLDWPAAEFFVRSRPDVIHGTNYVVGPTRRAGAVATVYDLTSVRFPDMVEPASLRYPILVQRAARRGAIVHVTARAIADEVVELLGVREDQVRVVKSGVDLPANMGDADRGRRLAGAESYVLALGTVEPRKGFPDLVAAFDSIAGSGAYRDIGLVFAGPDGWGADELVAAVDRSPNRRRIRRLGWVSSRDRSDVLAGATVLAMPSRYEGFGYPPLEAMAAGVPVVATRVGSLPEVLGDAAVLIAERDVEALAEAIVSVLDDDGARARLRAAGHAHVTTFSWSECATAMLEVYRDAAAH